MKRITSFFLQTARLLAIAVFALYALFLSSPVARAAEVPCTEARHRAQGVIVVSCDEDTNKCSAVQAPTPTGSSLSAGSSVYILGDSIANGARGDLVAAITDAGFTFAGGNADSAINADPGRAISADTSGNDPSGLVAAETDKALIAEADAVVIALGTNSGNEKAELENLIGQLVAIIRPAPATTPPIYWVNMFYESNPEGRDERNQLINSLASTLNYTVIDAASAGIQLGADKIHPTTGGNAAFASVIATALKQPAAGASGSGAVISGSGCSCQLGDSIFPPINNSITWGEGVWGDGSTIYESGLTGPFTIEQWAIHVLKNIARKSGVSEDVMLTQNKVIALVAWAKAEGGGVDGHNGTFNPLNTKSSYDDVGGRNQGNASNDTNSSGYSSFDFGVEAITRALFNKYQKRIGSALLSPQFAPDTLDQVKAGDFYSTNGTDVVNRLEAIYPGEGPYAMASVTGYVHGAPFNDGVGDREKYIESVSGALHSVMENYAAYAGKVLDGSPSGTAAPLEYAPSGGVASAAGSGSNNCGAATGSGTVGTDGYAFPLAPQDKSVRGIRENQTATAHHDETAAFDLTSGDSADVYAIYGGTIDGMNTAYKDIQGCTTIQLKGNDGFYYFYGHMKDATVQEGDTVVAGQKLGQIADDTNYDTRCWGGEPHLHIDRGCTIDGVRQTAGRDECRDPDFIPFLSTLYATLPTALPGAGSGGGGMLAQ